MFIPKYHSSNGIDQLNSLSAWLPPRKHPSDGSASAPWGQAWPRALSSKGSPSKRTTCGSPHLRRSLQPVPHPLRPLQKQRKGPKWLA